MDENLIFKHHQRHGDLVLIPSNQVPACLSKIDIDSLCSSLKCSRLASYESISSTDFRLPQVKMLKGDDPWVVHIDNGVKYKFNVLRNMFSRGNIHEKIRVSKLNCVGETIVDMFCGIGYFTLQFLVHTDIELVHAIDWNAEALECLRNNLLINHVDQSKCIIHYGDNNEVTPKNIADRVYLGLIPTSRFSWKTACQALKSSSGGVLHLHENVSIKESSIISNHPSMSEGSNSLIIKVLNSASKRRDKMLELWEKSVIEVIKELFKEIYPDDCWTVKSLGWHKVKSFAPGILHMVLDVDCRPCR